MPSRTPSPRSWARTYADWEWVLVDDCSPDAGCDPGPARALAAATPAVRVHERRRERRHRGGLAATRWAWRAGEFVALLDHDDVLAPSARSPMAEPIDGTTPTLDYLYSDQDRMTVEGETHSPFRKPDWSPERLRHHMYTTHFSVLRRGAGASRSAASATGYDGSQDHDLVLRVTERARSVVHIPEVLYHWREVPGSAAGDAEAKPWAWDAGVRAVQDHLDRIGHRGHGRQGPGARAPTTSSASRTWTTPRQHRRSRPSGPRAMVRGADRDDGGRDGALGAGVHARTSDLEIVVVYDTPTPPSRPRASCGGCPWATDAAGADRVHRAVQLQRARATSAHSTPAARSSSSSTTTWKPSRAGVLEHLIAPLREPGVGATGPKLLFEGSRIQHAGLVYGSGTITHSYYRVAASDQARGLRRAAGSTARSPR